MKERNQGTMIKENNRFLEKVVMKERNKETVKKRKGETFRQ